MYCYTKIIFCFFVVVNLVACSNAVTYHHSERTGLSLEARSTDPQQPLQGTFGLKTRTILVTPGKKTKSGNDTSGTGNGNGEGKSQTLGEALSVISDFKLKRESEGVWGRTTIKSAFITGEAAVIAPAESAKALSGLGIGDIGDLTQSKAQTLRKVYEQIKAMANGEDKTAQAHLKHMDGLSKMLPDITKNTYYFIEGENLKKTLGKDVSFSGDFLGVLNYEIEIRQTITSISRVENDRKYKVDNKIIEPAAMAVILQDKKRAEKERADYFATIGNSHVIDAAAAYVISVL